MKRTTVVFVFAVLALLAGAVPHDSTNENKTATATAPGVETVEIDRGAVESELGRLAATQPEAAAPRTYRPEWLGLGEVGWYFDHLAGQLPVERKVALYGYMYHLADEVAASSGFRWQNHTEIGLGCVKSPGESECPLGQAVYYPDGRITVFLDWGMFRSPEDEVKAVLAHEFAHVWQFMRESGYYYSDGPEGTPGLELHADCLATWWGYRSNFYWDCPDEAVEMAGQIYMFAPLD